MKKKKSKNDLKKTNNEEKTSQNDLKKSNNEEKNQEMI